MSQPSQDPKGNSKADPPLGRQVKLGYLATQHAHLTAKNIQASMDGQPMKSWKPNGGMQVLRQIAALSKSALFASQRHPCQPIAA